MSSSVQDWIGSAIAEVELRRTATSRVVFVCGNFNVVHPGHLRLLKFAAECGDLLVVGVYADGLAGNLLPQASRLEGIQSLGVVSYAFVLQDSPAEVICRLRPDVVVKGKEHEAGYNSEQAAVDSYGGSLLFCSGEAGFSSFDLLQQEREAGYVTFGKPKEFLARHNFSFGDLITTVDRFSQLSILVIGDLIIDEYIGCDALGMSQEDPTLVVSPISHDRFIGGAGIVAAHAKGFGASVRYLSVVGSDSGASYAREMLERYAVDAEFVEDSSRPTTMKQRYRVGEKTLLRVSHLRQHDIGGDLIDVLYKSALRQLDSVDLVIFSDFNYGALPQTLVDLLVEACQRRGVMMVADSQASSQMSDVSRFKGMWLLTPTEREARLATHDSRSGLVVLAEKLLQKADASHVLMTLGADGLLIHAPKDRNAFITDRLPAFNRAPRDVSGAGDSMLTCTSMAMAVGSDIWRGAYLGAVAAASQIGRVGNIPLSAKQIISELRL